ncbi:hypothetical protein Sjap_019487 [Stephania japonica]|uniref:Uncharacterized protein n=1 Tax=Stephania japonica TaxID=461633 RepID=A0AAP0F650_9MAGN
MKVQTSFSPERILRGDRGDHNHHHHNHNHNQQDQKLQDKKNNSNNNNNNNEGSGGAGASAASSETAQDSKRGGGSSSGSDAIAVWLPKFEIGLTTKEKEEDFMAIKGSKLPLRPKKRAKFVQRTLNFVCPGTLLCDLTLERYEVREKKVSKKETKRIEGYGEHGERLGVENRLFFNMEMEN